MNYYLYLSRPKLDMLASQLPPGLGQQLGAEIGASIGVASLKVKTGTIEPNDHDKLKLVEAQIEKSSGLGSLTQPRDWIKDTWDVRAIEAPFARDMFALVGCIELSAARSSYFLLGGSAHNIIGNAAATTVPTGLSYLPYFMEAFSNGFAEWEQAAATGNIWLKPEPARIRHGRYPQAGSELALSVRELYTSATGGAPMRVEFVARRLAREISQSGNTAAFVYSPLYVALAGSNS